MADERVSDARRDAMQETQADLRGIKRGVGADEMTIRRRSDRKEFVGPAGTPVPSGYEIVPNPPAGETVLRKAPFWQRMKMQEGKLGPLAGPAAQFLTPESWTEAGIQAGLFAAPGVGPVLGKVAPKLLAESPIMRKLVERGLRVAMPAAGGGVGAAVEGKSIPWEILRGAGYGATGEGLTALIENVARATGTKTMERLDSRRLGEAISGAVKEFGTPQTTEDLYKLAVTSGGQAALDEARKTALADIAGKLKTTLVRGVATERQRGFTETGAGSIVRPIPPQAAGHDAIEVPSLHDLTGTSLMSLQDAANWLSNLGDRGWLMSQKLKEGLDAGAARALRAKARKEIVTALDARVPGTGAQFDQALKQYSKGKTILTFLQQPGIFADGRLNMNAARDALAKKATQRETFGQQTEGRLTADEVDRFYRALFRGGPMTGRDVPGSIGIHASVSHLGTPYVGVSRPRLPSFAGAPSELPWWARPTSSPKATAPAVPLTFGLIGLTREREQ